jgi:hypothetical protein
LTLSPPLYARPDIRPRSHGRWPPRQMSMATPGQARLSLVRASPCPRLMRGPSRHHELFAASTRFSIVSSVGPAGRHQHRRAGRRWQAAGAGRGTGRGAGCRQGRGGGLPPVSLPRPARVGVGDDAARRSAPPRRSPRAWRRWPTGCRPRASGRWCWRPPASSWKPIWYLLEERGFQLLLVNARHVQAPARPQDRRRRCRLAVRAAPSVGCYGAASCPRRRSASCGIFAGSRKRLIQAHSAECQRIQKTLEDAGSKLGSVATDVLGVSGRAILEALVAGERDPKVLAELAKGKLRKQAPAVAPGPAWPLRRPPRAAGRAGP